MKRSTGARAAAKKKGDAIIKKHIFNHEKNVIVFVNFGVLLVSYIQKQTLISLYTIIITVALSKYHIAFL